MSGPQLSLPGDRPSTVIHLMLREEMVAAIREGKFHIYAVKTTDTGKC